MLGEPGFENAYALAMTRKRATELGIKSIADLTRHAPNLSVAGDYEFFGRPEWAAFRANVTFRAERQMQAEFMYPAAGKEVDVIAAYTSDGRIARYDLVVLEDPKQRSRLTTRFCWSRPSTRATTCWQRRCGR